MTRKQFSGIGLLLFGSVLSALSLPAALGLDRRPTAPRPQPNPQPPFARTARTILFMLPSSFRRAWFRAHGEGPVGYTRLCARSRPLTP